VSLENFRGDNHVRRRRVGRRGKTTQRRGRRRVVEYGEEKRQKGKEEREERKLIARGFKLLRKRR
jgi:hypothetical protein